jgi:uncharacterized protein YndB with AHSA1/START domain
MQRLRLVLTLPGIFAAPIVAAEVTDAAAGGFSILHSVEIAAPRADVWVAAIDDISEWWSDDHTLSGDAGRMSIDARPQGCFCEMLGATAGVVHMTVTFVNPTVMLRLSGGLGPLGLMGTAGNMTWEFDDSETGTTLTLRYAVGGYLPQGLDRIAPAVDGVLAEQLHSLKRYVESPRPAAD